MMSLQALVKKIDASLIGLESGQDVLVSSLCSDTRTDCSNQLFAAIPGENFDGHDYISNAQAAGAGAVLVEKSVNTNLPQLKVDNVLEAMADCCLAWRRNFSVPVVAITGSAGKTTVKEMLGNVLGSHFGDGVITLGNYNNEIGVPLTVTRLNASHHFAVVEMGMNHSGEIERLSNMVQPDFALINNASAAHLEGVGTIADVAAAKGEIVSGLSDDGILFINADDDFADYWKELHQGKPCISFGLDEQADVSCRFKLADSKMHLEVNAFGESMSLKLPVLGEHNVRNALGVIAVALKMGVSKTNIIDSLERFSPPANRAGKRFLNKNIVLVDDSYNANLASMNAAIDLLMLEAEQSENTKTVLILGDIGELGEQASDIHQQVGEYAKQRGVSELWTTGEFAVDYCSTFGEPSQAFESKSGLINGVCEQLDAIKEENQKTIILVKGSRFNEMEEVVLAIESFVGLDESHEQRALSHRGIH